MSYNFKSVFTATDFALSRNSSYKYVKRLLNKFTELFMMSSMSVCLLEGLWQR
jgi:hypothetical protein